MPRLGQAGTGGTINQNPGYPIGTQNGGGAGGAAQDTSVLRGGGGGGGGSLGFFPGEADPGPVGGAGGGGLFFTTPGTVTIEDGASLNANGGNGQGPNIDAGSSGGGGGGELWFLAGQKFENDGSVEATGGAGGNPYYTGVGNAGLDVGGSGSGGQLIIDSNQIVNNGTLDVSDGLGGTTYGGQLIEVTPEPSGLLIVCPALAGVVMLRRRREKGGRGCCSTTNRCRICSSSHTAICG